MIDSVLFSSLKEICSGVTEDNYNDSVTQGYRILIQLHGLGYTQEQVYQPLLQYHKGLGDGLPSYYIADIMDFVVGWCAPQWHIWRSDGEFDRGR